MPQARALLARLPRDTVLLGHSHLAVSSLRLNVAGLNCQDTLLFTSWLFGVHFVAVGVHFMAAGVHFVAVGVHFVAAGYSNLAARVTASLVALVAAPRNESKSIVHFWRGFKSDIGSMKPKAPVSVRGRGLNNLRGRHFARGFHPYHRR
jgi:hypothetical protein